MFKYAGIIVKNESVKVDRIFTYKIPLNLINKLKVGHRIIIPFGMGNKKINGFVLKLYETCENTHRIKQIIDICDDFTVFTEKDVKLIEIMRKKYICTYLESIRAIIPSGAFEGLKHKRVKRISVNKELIGRHNKEPYITIYNLIKEQDGIYNKSQLSKNYNLSQSSINTLIKNGFLKESETIEVRYDKRSFSDYEEKKLNYEQENSVDRIINSTNKKFLIHGITGSGKTEIYMKLVSYMIENNKDSIILVPEISLTPQMVERFKGRFGNGIAVFHSKLSIGERFDEWMRVKKGEVKVAIGARSAIFLPFKNLSMIIIDEEHENSYKSDSNPKYNAREIAELKSELYGAKIVLGSATPSIESYYKSMNDEYELIVLDKRADGATLPESEIVDMREELKNNNRSIFSRSLHNSIENCLKKGEQIILFLNRRGFSTFVSCRQCGFVFKCNNCDIAMTYHNSGNYLSCHYCGEKIKVPKICPKCGSKYVKYFGTGTEKIEKEVKRIFPSARTIRMDFDTTRKKDAYENIYNNFKEGRSDILIGTQMIAKGLDFKNVTLVGAIAADISLNLPDFRSSERTFQLITQVSGRAGRGKKQGKVIIQTYTPENYSIILASQNNYEEFYKHEIVIRKDMNYPPYSRILCINFLSKDEQVLIKKIQKIGEILKRKLYNKSEIQILGPCPCVISKIKEQYRWQIVIKGDFENELALKIKNYIYDKLKEEHNKIKLSVDINPNTLL